MASSESNREEEERQLFESVFGYGGRESNASHVKYTIRIKRIRSNDPETDKLFVEWRDATKFSDLAWRLIGRYIANNTHLKYLDIRNALCDSKASMLFSELVGSSSLKSLNFFANNFGTTGIQRMVRFFQNSPNLSFIDLSYSNHINTAAFEVLVNALDGKCVKKLDLINCCIDDVSALGNVTLPHLQTLNLNDNSIQNIGNISSYTALENLDLNNNNIGTDGCRVIAHLLQKEDTNLATLHLDDNDINNEGAEIIANSIKHNTKLKILHLVGSNNITEMGYTAFLKMLTDISSITNTYNSNHTLTDLSLPLLTKTRTMNVRKPIWRHIKNMLNINEDISAGKEKIIQYQLNSSNRTELSDLQGITCPTHNSLFAQIDPVVLPDVLSLIGRHYSQNDLYCALITTASDLTSLVNKPVAIKEKIEKKKQRIASLNAEFKRKVEVLAAKNKRQTSAINAEINELNEELQSLSLPPGLSNDDTASENTTNIDNENGKKRRRDS